MLRLRSRKRKYFPDIFSDTQTTTARQPTKKILQQTTMVHKPQKNESHDNPSFVNGHPLPDSMNSHHSPVETANAAKKNSELTKLKSSESRRLKKNVAVLCIAFILLFTAFQSMSNLQSTINSEAGLGTASLSTIYSCIVISCATLPTLLIKKLSCKWTLVGSMLCYSVYIAAQLYASYYTLIPGAIILGLGAAPMWISQSKYLTQVGHVYASLKGENSEDTIVRFFGFFFLSFQTSQVWGNLIASTVLSVGLQVNRTSDEQTLQLCGANFCDESSTANVTNENLKRPSDEKIYMLAGIYLTCALLSALLVALFIDPLTRYGEKEISNSSDDQNVLSLLSATYRQFLKPTQLLLVPLTIYLGLEQGFTAADFTQAYISCTLGIHHIGYVMICFGVANSLSSLLWGYVAKIVGRSSLLALGFLIDMAILIAFLRWVPDPDYPYLLYVAAAIWGVADAIWQTQVNAYYGILFPDNEEAAFSNFRLWESLGFIMAFAYSKTLCITSKLSILIAVLMIGAMGYTIAQFIEQKKRKTVLHIQN